MRKLVIGVICMVLALSLIGCGTKSATGTNANVPYAGAPKIVRNGCEYFASGLDIVNELPDGYSYAGELTEEEKEYAYIDGSKYYTQDEAAETDEFYVYQECGTPISDTEIDNTQRQWAYVKWSKS